MTFTTIKDSSDIISRATAKNLQGTAISLNIGNAATGDVVQWNGFEWTSISTDSLFPSTQYTPTIVSTTNVTINNSQENVFFYRKIGKVLTISGQLEFTFNSANYFSTVEISMPDGIEYQSTKYALTLTGNYIANDIPGLIYGSIFELNDQSTFSLALRPLFTDATLNGTGRIQFVASFLCDE